LFAERILLQTESMIIYLCVAKSISYIDSIRDSRIFMLLVGDDISLEVQVLNVHAT